jgi:putative spermidine/putrescine transport system ATP-binding protein
MAYLELNNISKLFGKTIAVEDFNLHVEKGELVSFLGPSGCGKTTTLRMVAGFEIPTTGKIIMGGKDVTNQSPNQRDVGMIFQSYALFPNLTVAGNVGFGLKIAKKPTEEIKKRTAEMLELIHMPEYGNRYPYQLSGGQQQRVALARALALSPDVLLLDEPLSALDAKIRVSLRAEIRSIQQELGITAIYVTHDQEEALSISDRIVVMYNGHIEQIGSPFKVYNFPETAFVASFIGTLNAFNADIIDPKTNTIQVGNIQMTTEESLQDRKVGDKLMIAIRPERLSFSSEQKKANLINCQIENITFLGSIVRVEVKSGDTHFYMDTFNNPFLELPKVGETVEITCSRQAVIILQH